MRARDDPEKFVPIGSGSLGAWMRMGLAELRNAVAHPQSNVTAGMDAGMYGVATQYEINQERHGEPLSKGNEASSIIDERIKQADMACDGRGRETPEMDRE